MPCTLSGESVALLSWGCPQNLQSSKVRRTTTLSLVNRNYGSSGEADATSRIFQRTPDGFWSAQGFWYHGWYHGQ
jgi:hypothetical protein